MLQLFTRLGFDTGWTPENETYVDEIRAGCEWHVEFDVNKDTPVAIRGRIAAAPRVMKTPDWSVVLKWLFMHGLMDTEHVFVPLRDIDQAARSRLAVGLDWMVADESQGEDRERDQANIMALALGRTIEACFLYEVPCTLMRFPTIVTNWEYCYHKLRPVLDEVSEQEFLTAWRRLARPQQIQTA